LDSLQLDAGGKSEAGCRFEWARKSYFYQCGCGLRTWIDTNREKLRARAAIVQAKAEWEKQERRDDLLLPSGFQLERARALLADPGDIGTDDIKEFILLSSAREEAERKQREADAARVRQQRIIRWAFAAVGAVMLIASGIVGLLQWDKARQLTKQEAALAESEQQLDHAHANIIALQSENNLLRADDDSALRLASLGTRIDLSLRPDTIGTSPAAVALAVAVSRGRWRRTLGGHDGAVNSAASAPTDRASSRRQGTRPPASGMP